MPLALVQKVLTDQGEDGDLKATGVLFIHEGTFYVVNAKREVIVSAGWAKLLEGNPRHTTDRLSRSTLKSPQVLELSGIGRTEVLEKIGVPIKVDLPGVGENVQDHLVCGIAWGASPQDTSRS